MTLKIAVETHVPISVENAWRIYTSPNAITEWSFASPDWHCPSAEVDLREGGRHTARMEAKDGSMGFDFAGTYTVVDAPHALTIRLEDGRESHTTFTVEGDGTRVRTEFDPDETQDREMQRGGWQAILNNFAAFASNKIG